MSAASLDDGVCNPDARRGYVRLADGRRLSYTEWGARSGRPVLEFRGLPSSSLGDAIDHTKLADAQVRRITVDAVRASASTARNQVVCSTDPDAVGANRWHFVADRDVGLQVGISGV